MKTAKAGARCCVVVTLALLLGHPAWALDWTTAVVDSQGIVGSGTAIVISGSGQPFIAYRDHSNDCQKYAVWDGNAWETGILDDNGDTGGSCSMAVDPSGQPGIVYRDYLSTQLRYAHWNGVSWDRTVVVQRHWDQKSLDYDSQGRPHTTFEKPGVGLSLASWNGSTWDVEPIGPRSCYADLDIDDDDVPHILYGLYHGGLAAEIRYLTSDGTSWHTTVVDDMAWSFTWLNLKVDDSGTVHICYTADRGTGGRVVWYGFLDGESWQMQQVDAGSTETNGALALDEEGLPHVCYLGPEGLKYAAWDGTQWQIDVVDSVGHAASIAIDRHGRAHISYWDEDNGDLKYALG
ncbi:MAG: hypothetical protein AMS14_10815, partial [Planctomycetes bacterium DG_20]